MNNLIHLSFNGQLPKTLEPRLPDGTELTDKGDLKVPEFDTPRVSFSTSLVGAIRAIYPNIADVVANSPDGWVEIHIYAAKYDNQRLIDTKQLTKDRLVWDAHLTDEVCVLDPIEVIPGGSVVFQPVGDGIVTRAYNHPRGERLTVYPEAIKVKEASQVPRHVLRELFKDPRIKQTGPTSIAW